MKEEFETKDKQITPFLFTQSVQFLGTRIVGKIIYFRFTPFIKCQELVNNLVCRKAPLVQPKDLLDAIETFRDIIFEMKEKDEYGGHSK